ncbi:MAG: DNRLRE domain-containing protein [Planctomycetaceae bacterium]|nr:DNRLRE domain-containing protein [Planctomycetaceae bacterium]
MRVGLISAMLVLAILPAMAAAEPQLLNGDFESYGAAYTSTDFGEWRTLRAVSNWTNLSGLNYQASSAMAGFEETPSISRYLRLVDDVGQTAPQNVGHIVQDLGVMTAGETYIFTADAFRSANTHSSITDYGVTASFVTAATTTADILGGGLASQTLTIATPGVSDTFNFQYTATEADTGNRLYLRLDATPVAAGHCTRGGIDNADLTVLVDGKINVAGKNNLGTRDQTGSKIETEYVYRQDAPITINGVATSTVYTGTHDTTVYEDDAGKAEDDPTRMHGDSAGLVIDPSCTSQNGNQGQSFLRFGDFVGTGEGQVSQGTKITRAYVGISQTDGIDYAPFWVYARRLNGAWDEASLTWDTVTFNGNVQGGLQVDGVECSTDSAFIIPAGVNLVYQRYSLDATGDIQYFIDHPELNNGWGLPPTAAWDYKGMDLVSSEGGEADRPTLTVYADMGQTMTTLAVDQTYVFELSTPADSDRLKAYQFGLTAEAILDLNGAILEVNIFAGATPVSGAYRLLQADTLVGNFADIILPDIAGAVWDLSGLSAGGDGYLRLSVPEPATLSLLALGATATMIRRRRR